MLCIARIIQKQKMNFTNVNFLFHLSNLQGCRALKCQVIKKSKIKISPFFFLSISREKMVLDSSQVRTFCCGYKDQVVNLKNNIIFIRLKVSILDIEIMGIQHKSSQL